MPVVIESPEDPQFALYANLLKTLRKNSGYPVVLHVYTEEPTIDFRALAEDFRELHEEPIKIKRMDKTHAIISMMGCQVSIRRLKKLPPMDDVQTRLESFWDCEHQQENWLEFNAQYKYVWVVSLIPDIAAVDPLPVHIATECLTYLLSLLINTTGEGKAIIDTTSSINMIEIFNENVEYADSSKEFPVWNWVTVVQLKDGEDESWFQTIGLTRFNVPECLIRSKNSLATRAIWFCGYIANQHWQELFGLTPILESVPEAEMYIQSSPFDEDSKVIFYEGAKQKLIEASQLAENQPNEGSALS